MWPDTYVTNPVFDNPFGQHRHGFRWMRPQADGLAAPPSPAAAGVDAADGLFVGRIPL